MSSSKREQILATCKQARMLPVKFAGQDLHVKSLKVGEILEIRKLPTNEEQSFALLLACLCDDDGTPIFTKDDAKFFEEHEGVDLDETNKAVSECLTVNRLNKKGFKESEKNS